MMSEMYLFQVALYFDGKYYYQRFILAPDNFAAIAKYIEIYPYGDKKGQIVANSICKRDEIIPTIEPLQEFKHEKL